MCIDKLKTDQNDKDYYDNNYNDNINIISNNSNELNSLINY